MGGGTMHIEMPMIHCKTTSPTLPSLTPSSSSPGLNYAASVHNTQLLQQSRTSVSNSCSQTESALGKENGFYNEIFGSVPSQFEVESAISALQNFVQRICSSESSEFKRPVKNLGGFGRVEEAFHLLTNEPIIQRVVFSISTDKAVWDAVMNNEMVRQLQDSYVPQAQNNRIQNFNEESNVIFSYILSWIMHITKTKVTQLIQKFDLLVNQMFKEPKNGRRDEESKDEIDDIVRSSFILSLIVLFIVVVERVHKT